MSRKANPMVIGAFVLGGIALLVGGVVVLSSTGLFRETEHVVVFFRQTVFGLRTGAPVMFKGIEIGTVQDIRINLARVPQQRPEDVRIEVILAIDRKRLKTDGATLDLTPETVRLLVNEGLRAELTLESYLTGLRFVTLDFRPGTPAELVNDPTAPYPEIPSLPARTEVLQEKLTTVIDKLSRVDIEGLVNSARELTDGAREIVTAPELRSSVKRLDDLTANLEATVRELHLTAVTLGPKGEIGSSLVRTSSNAAELTAQGSEAALALRRILQPDGALATDFEATLTELRDAARSLRQTSDQLRRDPGAILRGGEP